MWHSVTANLAVATTGPGGGTRPAVSASAVASILGWSQGRKYQGGTGAYRVDGHVPPDVIYGATSTVNSLGRRDGGQELE